MLDKKDLKLIAELFDKLFDKNIMDFFEKILAPYLDKRFGEHDKKFDEIEVRFDKVDRKLEKIDDRLDKHDVLLADQKKARLIS